jgi:adenylate cyclase
MNESRKLAAILAVDVVGFSRLTGADEDRTLARLRALRSDLIDPTIAVHRGRVVKRTGDGALVEFRSVVDAVRCAIEVQNAMIDRNSGLPPERRIEFRIGIHLGDVVEESDGDLMGDGVNIAARLEGVAQPGSICLSEDAYRQVRTRLDLAITDLGETKLKNIIEPVRIYQLRVGQPVHSNTSAQSVKNEIPASQLPLPDRRSIAILPFQNMSTDSEQEHFADGLAEDIITSLSKVRGLFVIARNSTFTYKNRAVDVRQVARELGVQYVLEGSVRRSGERLRVTAQLIEAASGSHVWAERYDRPVRDVFDVQDEMTKEIVAALSVELTVGERALVFSRSTRSLEAWLEAMRGFSNWMQGSPKGIRQARAHFERAVAIDPNCIIAWAFIGWTHYTEVRFGFSADPTASIAKAAELAEKCVSMNPNDPQARGLRGGIWMVQGRFEEAVRECEIAINGSPSDAFLQVGFARVVICAGDAARGVQAIREAIQLNPFHPTYYRGVLANALEELGQNVEAIETLVEAVRLEPEYFSGHLRLASLYGLTGQIEEAQQQLAIALRINPKFSMAMADAFYASAKKESTDRFKLGLTKAGLSG